MDNKRDGRNDVQEVYKKDSRKTISTNPERSIFKIFTLLSTVLASKGDTKLNKLLACPKKIWY